jgi:SAM-dependent methyltransferase/predicted transcriptional regulator
MSSLKSVFEAASSSSDLRSRVNELVRSSLLSSSLLFGDELGLFKAMRGEEAISADQLAQKCNVDLRHVQEWLFAMVAFKIVQSKSGTTSKCPSFKFPEEYAVVLIDEDTPLSGIGMLQYAVGGVMSHQALLEGYKSGKGIDVCDMDERCSTGIRRWFRTVYDALLVKEWLPVLSPANLLLLETGGLIADIGCGHGYPTMLLARRFPRSRVIGYDYDRESIEIATKLAREQGLDNVEFKLVNGSEFGSELGSDSVFDALFFFIAFHDFSNPEKTIKHAHLMLKPKGFVFSVEPFAGNTVEETMDHPNGTLFTLISGHYCMPVSKCHALPTSRVLGSVFLTPDYNTMWVTEGNFANCNLLQVKNTPNHRVFEINKSA